jgi:hypothetical protein
VISLRKSVLAFGIFLIFLSIIFISYSNFPIKINRPHEVANVQNSWEVSHYFNLGDNISLSIASGDDWSLAFEDYTGQMPVNVTIIAPDGGETKFHVFYEGYPEPPPPGQPWPIYIARVELVSRDEDALEVAEPVSVVWIGGVVKQNGTFTAKVDLWWGKDPPRSLIFYIEIFEQKYPYTNFLPVGCIISVVGFILSAWGVKDKKRKVRRKSPRLVLLGFSETPIGYSNNCNCNHDYQSIDFVWCLRR